MFSDNVGVMKFHRILALRVPRNATGTESGEIAHVFPHDSVGRTVLRTREVSALMRHPAGTIWRAYRKAAAERERGRIIIYPAISRSSLPALLQSKPTRIPKWRLILLILVSSAKTLVIARLM